MRHRIPARAAVVAALALAAACSDVSGPAADQAAVLAAAADQLGFMMDTSTGAAGVTGTAAAAPAPFGAAPVATAGDTVTAPRFWGRIRVVPGGPRPVIHRDVTIQGDTATLALSVDLQGLFLVDTSADSAFDPVAKPMAVTGTQSALFVRDPSASHGWRAVSLSLQQWQPTADTDRTVTVTGVQVYVNDTLRFAATNPDSLYDVVRRIPRIHLGDTVRVVAVVTNADASFVPPTFVFLHLRHADATDVDWHRVPMADDGDGTWSRTWVARETGIDRFTVDAIDAGTLTQGSTPYRAEEWAVPYRIE